MILFPHGFCHHLRYLTIFPTACQPPYFSFGAGGNTGGDHDVEVNSVSSFEDCCNACFYGTTRNCIGYAYYQDVEFCELTVSSADEVNPALANAQCPLAQRDDAFAADKEKNTNGFLLGPCLGIVDILY